MQKNAALSEFEVTIIFKDMIKKYFIENLNEVSCFMSSHVTRTPVCWKEG